MKDGWLQHRLAPALVVLALWTTDVMASGDPAGMRARAWLFGLSIEELMDVSIDSLDDGSWCAEDTSDAPVQQALEAVASGSGTNSHITNDETQTLATSIAWDDVDYEW